MKRLGSNDVRSRWAEIQAHALTGEPTLVDKHTFTTCVIMSPEWADFYNDEHWIEIFIALRAKFPRKTDAQLVKEVLQRWHWQQSGNGSKDAKLDEALSLLRELQKIVTWVANRLDTEKQLTTVESKGEPQQQT